MDADRRLGPWVIAKYLKQYIEAADAGNWPLCRAICNKMGCGPGSTKPRVRGLSLEERIQWRRMYELCYGFGREKEWPTLRAVIVEES